MSGWNRATRRALAAESAHYPAALRQIPREDWPRSMPPSLIEVWRSQRYLVQVFEPRDGATRLSMCRTLLDAEGTRWADGIPWEDLQRLKRECGRGHLDAVEIYPADRDVVDVANMRHLWVLEPGSLPFAWRRP